MNLIKLINQFYLREWYNLSDYALCQDLDFDSISENRIYNNYNIGDTSLSPRPFFGKIKIPRYYTTSKTKDLRILISNQILNDANQCLYLLNLNPPQKTLSKEYLMSWRKFCIGAEHGGSFWDFWINRPEGDTPFVISTRMPNFIHAYLSNIDSFSAHEKVQIQNWIKIFYEYVNEYKPNQLNNHLAWRTYFCMLCGVALKDKKIIQDNFKYFGYLIQASIIDNGSMPLELGRTKNNMNYARLSGEALFLIYDLLRCGGFEGRYERISYFKINKMLNWFYKHDKDDFNKILSLSKSRYSEFSHCNVIFSPKNLDYNYYVV